VTLPIIFVSTRISMQDAPPSLIAAVFLVPNPAPFRDSLRSSQKVVVVSTHLESGQSDLKSVINGTYVRERQAAEITKVRRSEEQSDELAATFLTRKIARAWTSVQDTPPSPISKIILTIFLTFFAIHFAHRRLFHRHPTHLHL